MKFVIGFIVSSTFTLGFIVKDIISWFNGGTVFGSTHWVIFGMLGVIISIVGILAEAITIAEYGEYDEPINKRPMWWR